MKTLKAIITKEDGSRFSKKATIKVDTESAIQSGKKLLIAAWSDTLEKEYNYKEEDFIGNGSFIDAKQFEAIEKFNKINSILNNIEFLIINE